MEADLQTRAAGAPFSLGGEALVARASGALWVPAHDALIVADLHFGKAERNARRGGGFWPPYDGAETLTRLEREVAALSPALVIALGDSFDDQRSVEALDAETRARLIALAQGCRWVWARGNHDPAPHGLPGESADQMRLGGTTLRHIAEAGAQAEISGHYHPKAHFRMRGRRIARACFIRDTNRVILPAFGAYTGGLDVGDPALRGLFSSAARVILTGERALDAPLGTILAAA